MLYENPKPERDYYTKAEIDDKFEFRERMVEQLAAAMSTAKQQGFDLNNGTIIVGDDVIRFTSNTAMDRDVETKASIIAARALDVFIDSEEFKTLIRKLVRNAKRSKR